MEAETLAIRHWEDVVFQNRNKEYGAYPLRRAYAKRVLFGAVVTITVVGIILSSPTFFSHEEETGVVVFNPDDGIIWTAPPPIVEPLRPPKKAVAPPAQKSKSSRIVVTDEEIAQNEVEPVMDVASDDGVVSAEAGMPGEVAAVLLPGPTAPAEPLVREIAEVMPQYEGGVEAMMKFIRKKIRYPNAPKRLGIGGTVYVRFVVNGDGRVTDVEVIRGVHPDYDAEAARVISMLPSWTGGRHNGRPVGVRMVIPINFSLK